VRSFIIYTLHQIIRVRLSGHVARIREMRYAYRILVGKSEEKRPFRWRKFRWEDNIEINFLQENVVSMWTGLSWLGITSIGGLFSTEPGNFLCSNCSGKPLCCGVIYTRANKRVCMIKFVTENLRMPLVVNVSKWSKLQDILYIACKWKLSIRNCCLFNNINFQAERNGKETALILLTL
jgi:hypothetical protein